MNDQDDIEVTWDDQNMINSYAKVNDRKNEIVREIEKLDREVVNLEEAETEVVLGDEEVRFRIGEIFIEVDQMDAEELINSSREEIEEQLVVLNDELDEIRSQLAELKVKLYAKFGNSINLEDGTE
eukprot:TRINITY_DN3527_c0_g1_i1.p1 TRINITY_DN3527_c0_g1~~TRINITY_DN3527_c0_g1_i1.p1  ORF type:complete len:126 (-),score=46.31 TRINITY_DN3527_c0_g1_i1:50-427(-)